MGADKNNFVGLLRKGFWAISSIILFLINFEITFSQSEINEEASDLIYRQDFSEQSSEWEVKPNREDWGTMVYSVTGGLFQWEMNLNQDKGLSVKSKIKINLPEEGYQISLDTKFESTCEGCSSGLIFNFQDWDNYYYAELETDGDLSVYAFNNKKWTQVSDTVRAQNYHPPNMNKMTVINKGNNFEIRINDMSASRFTDDRFHGGTVGLRAEGTKGTKNIIYFDNLDVRKKKLNENEAPDRGVDSPYHMNPVTLPLQDLYPSRNSSDLINYMIDISAPFTFRKEGSGDLFCLKESDGKACLFIIRHFNEWNSPEEAADTIIDDYAKQVNNLEIYHQQSTYSAEGYPAYWVGAYFSAGENNYESSHLFIQAKNGVFQVFTYAPTDLIEQYRESLKKIAESFSYSK